MPGPVDARLTKYLVRLRYPSRYEAFSDSSATAPALKGPGCRLHLAPTLSRQFERREAVTANALSRISANSSTAPKLRYQGGRRSSESRRSGYL